MKKHGFVILFLMSIALVIGCVSASTESPEPLMGTETPDFVLNTPLQEKEFFGIGGAKRPSIPEALSLAETRARQSLVTQLQSRVQTIITDYALS